jgi:predicted O-methyltransferase YrrM
MDRLFAAVKRTLDAFGERARLHRAASVEAARMFADGFFDLVFVDGDHTYAGATADLAAWWPKLRPGGIFCGDDYLWAEVKQAVDEFAAGGGRTLTFASKPGTSYPIWVIEKPA